MKNQIISRFFLVLAFLFSHVMVAFISYSYCRMTYGIRYEGFSAPAEIVFLWGIPFLLLIALCLFTSFRFHRKKKERNSEFIRGV